MKLPATILLSPVRKPGTMLKFANHQSPNNTEQGVKEMKKYIDLKTLAEEAWMDEYNQHDLFVDNAVIMYRGAYVWSASVRPLMQRLFLRQFRTGYGI